MRLNHLYYHLKPYLPRSLRMMIRRQVACRKRKSCHNVWPISEAAARPPEGWPGWPDGKKFALVLTHDVEGPKGLANCRPLMQLEMDHDIRSSFNFIPEGNYHVSDEFRAELAGNGFEIGVHDLHHDGRLYCSEKTFFQKAEHINRHLKEWNAAGFRSGFMHHNLDWLRTLDIKYDASTFDTDPFEPQPDGVGTIFPFWVPSFDNGHGYVELPYTLPQDSTLFLLFHETSIEIWKRKLDWIAQHGGMALVIVHPDYINLNGAAKPGNEYPRAIYERFLDYVRSKYTGQFWNALPRDVAKYCATIRPQRPHIAPRRICMISFSSYESDNRVMRYAEALAARRDSVDVLAIKKDPGQGDVEKINGVRVHRLQLRTNKNQQYEFAYLLPLLKFCWRSAAWLARRKRNERFDLIHVHNVPDFLVFATWAPKLAGAKIILDIHDILPEFYASKFHHNGSDLKTRLLKKVELASARFANHIIISNHLWRDKFASRSAPPEKCSVFLNHVDRNIFHPRPRTRTDGKFIILFPGGLQWHQGLDIAIQAFARAAKMMPNAELHIYGDGNVRGDLILLAQQLAVADKVQFRHLLPVQEIADVMANADLGIVPKRADSFGNEAYSTKIMEFMSLGIPVIVSRTKIDSYYFDDSLVRFFESGNADDLANAMVELFQQPDFRQRLVASARDYVRQNNWDIKRDEYLNLVDLLVSGNGARSHF
ncbi:MAG TPA: glycosyltransferase [Verrucomicrobiae bacterium]|nr:glycosyltransferase [Verrucomicrobiae bacterium]